MVVVSDTTAITSLLKIGELEWLRTLFQNVLIPEAVQTELLRYHTALPNWLTAKQVKASANLSELLEILDIGEAEAILLAKTEQAQLIIIDEKKGRKIAEDMGLNCIGLAGVLLLAKQRGIVKAIKPILNKLESDAGFYFSASMRRKLLITANEIPD